uniref:MADS-box domain-containing protein n=1 Tax=Setaria italica TaxID=4555 RepID=K3YZW4_SETIT
MAQSHTRFSERTNTLLSMAKDLSRGFSVHVAVITFSPTSEPKRYGAPTVDSVIHTYHPKIHRSLSPFCSETTSVGKQNWWDVDVEALGVDELPVFVRALEVLRTNIQRHLDTMESSQKEKMQP